jgi:hypothetical protein
VKGALSLPTVWEYLTIREAERAALPALGREGWELVAVGATGGEPTLYLKRAALGFRERVTLDQRQAYYASRGLAPGANDAGRATE